MEIDALAGVVERLLPATVHSAHVLKRQDETIETVVRLELRTAGITRTVVAKCGRSFQPFDPAPVPKSSWALFNEWAALSLLGTICPGVAPKLLGADREEGVLVLEDLGDNPTLGDVLHGADRAEAEERLLELARVLARMHSATSTAVGAYQRVRDELGPGGTLDGYLDLPAAYSRFRSACEHLGMATPPETEGIFAWHPDGAVIHGDIGPGNESLTPDGLRLIDFEVGGIADPMIEAAVLRMLLEQGEADYAVPNDLVAAMESEYCRLAPMPPRAYERGCAYMFCMELGWAWREGAPTEGERAKSAHRAHAFLDLHARNAAAYAGVAEVASRVAQDNALPIWPALA